MLREEISKALKDALLAKNQIAVSTVRLILAALKDRDIAARGKGNSTGIDEGEIMAMLQTMIKQRRESIAMYEQGGRPDLARQEAEEIKIIERFLPQQLSAEETDTAVAGAIAELDAKGLKDMGRVMAALRERYPGQMDFGRASAMARKRLA